MNSSIHKIILLIVFIINVSQSRITHRSIDKDYRNLIELETPFGFIETGNVELEISDVKLISASHQTPNFKGLGFFLVKAEDESTLRENYESMCFFDYKYVIKLFSFDQQKFQELLNGDVSKFVITMSMGNIEDGRGKYIIYFGNCEPAILVSFRVKITMYNRNIEDNINYLSYGKIPLPSIYFIMFLVFSVLTGIWVSILAKQKEQVHSIHYLMLMLLILRVLTYFTQAGMLHYESYMGYAGGWNIAYYIFTFFRGVMFFIVIILIGTGWSYLKPFIGDNEKKILIIVIPLQVFANIAIIILDETSPVRTNWVTWQDLFHMLDIICCCAILFPIVWSIKHLREGSESDGKAAINIEKLVLFRQFYVLVVVYIYFTRIIVYLLETTVPFEYEWTAEFCSEAATLVFYIMVGMKFRPHRENRYLKLASDML